MADADPFDLGPPWTREQERRLVENGIQDFEGDHAPVVRLYDPKGKAFWILTAQSPRNPLLYWGIANLGAGPESGPIDYRHLRALNGGKGAEIDAAFDPHGKALSDILSELRAR